MKLEKYRNEMNNLFDDFFGRNKMWEEMQPLAKFTPSCDIEEIDSHYLLSFDLPGMKKDEIKVQLLNNQLVISGERNEERQEKSRNRTRTERFHGSFERSFTLPAGTRADQIESDYKDGVLRLAIPKNAALEAKQIRVGENRPGFWDRFLPHKKEDRSADPRVA